jgi:autotransporter family porin
MTADARTSLCPRPLAGAILLWCSAAAAAADNPQEANRAHLDVPPGTYTASTGSVFTAFGQGGSISGRDSLLLATAEGGAGRGITAFGAGSLVELANSRIVVTGVSGIGVEAQFGGEVRIAGTRIEIQKRGFGVIISNNSIGSLTDSSIIMEDAGSGILNSGALSLLRTSVETSALGATGLSAGGTTTGVVDSQLRTTGNSASAIETSQGVSVQISGSTLQTAGDRSYGVGVRSGATVDITGGTITTTGNDAAGIQMLAFNPTLITLRLDGVGIRTSGQRSTGIQLNNATELTMIGGSIDSVGSAVVAADDSALFAGARLTTSGDGASALRMTTAGGAFQLTDTQVQATGAGSWGAEVAGTFSMAGGSLDSAQYGAFRSDGGSITLSAGARASGGNGHLFDQASAAPTTLTMDGAVQATGDIGFVPGVPAGTFAAATTVALANDSVWTGATTGTVAQVSIASGSRWRLTAGSDVQALHLDGGTVAFSAPVADGFKTLRVDGDLTGAGTFAINARLGADGSPRDLLHVVGDTRGAFGLQVDNAGGTGGLTAEGIRVVQVDGASDGRFALAGRAVGGAYEYFLFKGRPTVADGNWYLRSEFVPPPPDPCDSDPTGPGCTPPPDPDPCDANPALPGCPPPTDPCLADPELPVCRPPPPICEQDPTLPACRPTPIYRPELAAYLANTTAAIDLFQYALRGQTGAGTGRTDGARDGGLWLRVDGQQGRLPRQAGQLSVSQERSVVHIGVGPVDEGRRQGGMGSDGGARRGHGQHGLAADRLHRTRACPGRGGGAVWPVGAGQRGWHWRLRRWLDTGGPLPQPRER